MAKPDEKLTKTAILKRIYRVLELEYIGGRHHGVASADVESVARDGVVVMLSKEPVAGRPHLGLPTLAKADAAKGYAKRNRWSSTRRNIGSTREEYKVCPCRIRS